MMNGVISSQGGWEVWRTGGPAGQLTKLIKFNWAKFVQIFQTGRSITIIIIRVSVCSSYPVYFGNFPALKHGYLSKLQALQESP
jgi:hypothetical protein